MAVMEKEGLFYSEDERNTITLIRVIATMAVLAKHLQNTLPEIIGQIAFYGADGVYAFFLLTGYLVMHSWETRRSTKEYWCRRLGRTLPIYYFWLLVLIIARFDWITADPFAIPRAILMLEYVAPPTTSYSYCSMDLLGVMTIFMIFYLLIPLIAKWVHSLNDAFLCFWVIIFFTKIISKLYMTVYDSFCNPVDVSTMSGYLVNALYYFAGGILIYFGKRENDIPRLLAYLMFITLAGRLYPFLQLDRSGYLIPLIAILLCYPLKVLSHVKGVLQYLNHLGMGVYVSQYLCFDWAKALTTFVGGGNAMCVVLMFLLPYFTAFVLYHCVEKPGAKWIKRFMKC